LIKRLISIGQTFDLCKKFMAYHPLMFEKPTLKSLSITLGIHPSLISRVLRGSSDARVSDEKRQLILKAAKDAGYRPDRMGRSLKFRSSKVVAVLIPDITNPFHSLLFRGAEAAARSAGYNVILCHIDDRSAQASEVVESVTHGLVDGVLVACAWTPDPRLQILQAAGLPYVLINRPSGHPEEVHFVPDDHETGRLAAQAIVDCGHQHIMAIFSDLRIGNMRRRRDSFVHQLSVIAPAVKLTVHEGVTDNADLRSLFQRVMSQAVRPSAIFAPHSQQASVILEEAVRHRIQVPGELSILGYGGDPDTALSAVCVPAEHMGRDGMKALLGMIEEHSAPAGLIYQPGLNTGVTLARSTR
jgi:LacI family transcriptional regulator